MSKKSKRKTLFLNDDEAKPITAGGVLIYKNFGGKLKFLVIDSRNMYEDIGGKIDQEDNTIYDTVAREVEEETNGQIKAKNIVNRVKNAPYIYTPRSKYVIFIVQASSREELLKKEDFGDMEIHDNFKRYIGWIEKSILLTPEIIKTKLNPRMRNRLLFLELDKLDKSTTKTKSMVLTKKLF